MRIIGGLHRGRPLSAPKGKDTRPTSDRTRESIFNILRHGGWHHGALEDATVLDVFAGTGALGLEALSQGAKHAAFIEREHPAIDFCKKNIAVLGEAERTAVLTFDATDPIPRPLYIEPRSLVFLDPPYGKYLGAEALKALVQQDWLKEGAICALEMSKKVPEILPAGFTLQDERVYGLAKVQFLIWGG
ncbi:MAG: 16S rRNA (guanine(966)-N(2))-methyltransferase RsmD [Alphaproteobacteria bacterium]|nr:16S rRNA (guanine(966)-N(2))-methyltransferase RsmD [Alphaproteobacteria bacterium]